MTVSEENMFYIFFSFLEKKGYIFTQNKTMLVSQDLRSTISWPSGKGICSFSLTRIQFFLCIFVIPAVSYLFTGFIGCLVNPRLVVVRVS